MNFYRSDFKHKIYGLYTGKYGKFEFCPFGVTRLKICKNVLTLEKI